MDQLSPQDAQFLYMESADNLTHVTSISIFDQTTVPDGKVVRFKDILAHIEGRLHMSPLFKRRLVRVPFELDLAFRPRVPRPARSPPRARRLAPVLYPHGALPLAAAGYESATLGNVRCRRPR
jgi:hypothetical protein